ncbi:MAG: hypothetical protein Q9M26_08460 [Mariprofundales bacterium]|nr:hypothetical protein [Mariprofundales bacterium]
MRRKNRRSSKTAKKQRLKQYVWILATILVSALLLEMVTKMMEDKVTPETIQASQHRQPSTPFRTPSQFQKRKENTAQMQKLQQLKSMADQLGITQGASKDDLKRMAESMGLK